MKSVLSNMMKTKMVMLMLRSGRKLILKNGTALVLSHFLDIRMKIKMVNYLKRNL